jgi:tetratricopeptide (TPR) repeat protein
MLDQTSYTNRKVIPRWRSFIRTPGHELISLQNNRPFFEKDDSFMDDALTSWRRNPTPLRALEALDSALIAVDPSKANEAARFIMRARSGVTDLMKRRASNFVSGDLQIADEDTLEAPGDLKLVHQQLLDQLHRAYARVRAHPKSPLDWLEVARLCTYMGNMDRARKSILVALNLAPENRFILRSATRFFMHDDDKEFGLQIIRRSDSTAHDPWLVAGEIAVSADLGKPSKLARLGSRLIRKHEHQKIHISELASALATEEYINGAHRNARRLFRLSAEEINDNAAAQLVWARERFSLKLEPDLEDVPLGYEAKSVAAFLEGDFRKSIEQCRYWLADEAISAKPGIHGSFVASAFLDDHETAAKFARQGLVFNPDSNFLRNNLTVALARSGNLSEADLEWGRIGFSADEKLKSLTMHATSGLLEFRRGRIESGRQLYWQAIDLAKEKKNGAFAFRILLNLFSEELNANSLIAEQARTLVERLGQVAKKAKFPKYGVNRLMLEKVSEDALIETVRRGKHKPTMDTIDFEKMMSIKLPSP